MVCAAVVLANTEHYSELKLYAWDWQRSISFETLSAVVAVVVQFVCI